MTPIEEAAAKWLAATDEYAATEREIEPIRERRKRASEAQDNAFRVLAVSPVRLVRVGARAVVVGPDLVAEVTA